MNSRTTLHVVFAALAIVSGVGVILANPSSTGLVGLDTPALRGLGLGLSIVGGFALAVIVALSYITRNA